MELADYISRIEISLLPTDTIAKAVELFEAYDFTHLPIVNHSLLEGMLAKEEVIYCEDIHNTIDSLYQVRTLFLGKHTDTVLDLVGVFAKNETNIVPILDENQRYFGFLTLNEALAKWADTYFLKTDGFVLSVQKNVTDYFMSQVVQIVESNNSEMLGVYVSDRNDSIVQLTIKIKSNNINEVIQSFRRYGYEILNDLAEDSYLESLKTRSDYFMKYLNI